METNQKNKNLIMAVVVLLIVSFGLGGFVLYDKILNKENNKNSNQTTENNQNNCKENKYQIIRTDRIAVDGLAVLYNGEVFVNFYDEHMISIEDIYGEGKFEKLVETRRNYKEYKFGNLEFGVNIDKPSYWLKINVSNVKSIHYNIYGQALAGVGAGHNPKYGIIMIHYDKTVSFINTGDLIDGNVNPIKLNVSDVIDIENGSTPGGGAVATYLIKADGSKIDANTIIK